MQQVGNQIIKKCAILLLITEMWSDVLCVVWPSYILKYANEMGAISFTIFTNKETETKNEVTCPSSQG